MLESSNLARTYTPISHMQFLENISFSIKASLTLLMLAFFQKITVFGKNSIFTPSNRVRAVRDFLGLFWNFVRWKVTINENIRFANPAFRMRFLDCFKLVLSWKNDHGVRIFRHDVIIIFFWLCFFSRIKFSYRSKFNINIITGSGITTILFCKGLTRNPEMGNSPVWILPNIWRLGKVMDTKYGLSVSHRMLLWP